MVAYVPSNAAVLINKADYRYHVHIQVLGAGAIRIGQSKSELETPVGGVSQGLVISSADGIVSLWWSGPLYAIGEGGYAQVNFAIV